MATRFGAPTPNRILVLKVRWMVGGLCGVIIVLSALLIAALKDESTTVRRITDPENAVAATLQTINILSARHRIEQGVRIEPAMLTSLSAAPDQLPDGAILERDRDTVLGKFAKQLIPSGMPLNFELLTSDAPTTALAIPPGMRMVAITVDDRSGVDWLVRPTSRVDVLCTYAAKDKRKHTATVVPFAKVHSVDGITDRDGVPRGPSKGTRNISLVVSEKDAKRVELARNIGALSLILVGDDGNAPSVTPSDVDEGSIFRGLQEDKIEEVVLGRMCMRDPNSGRMMTFILTEKGWKPDGTGVCAAGTNSIAAR